MNSISDNLNNINLLNSNSKYAILANDKLETNQNNMNISTTRTKAHSKK